MKKIYFFLKQEISEKCYFKSTFKAKIVTLNGKSKKVVTLNHLVSQNYFAKYQMSSGPHGPIFFSEGSELKVHQIKTNEFKMVALKCQMWQKYCTVRIQ